MVYDTGKRILHLGVYEKVRLSKIEHKLLICLSSEDVVSYEEIKRYIGTEDLSVVKKRFYNKTGIRLKVIRGYGLRFGNEIYFE